jgi:regulatory protein
VQNKQSGPAESSALGVAIKFLATSERFEAEVRNKLREFDPDDVEKAIERLKERNLINDRRTAQSLYRARDGRRAVGSFRLGQELRRRGAPQEIVAELCEAADEPDRARTVLRLKYPLGDEPTQDPKMREKAFRFLVGRGFGFEMAHNAIRDYFTVDV